MNDSKELLWILLVVIMSLGYISYIQICNYAHWIMLDEMTCLGFALKFFNERKQEGTRKGGREGGKRRGMKKGRKEGWKNMVRF